MSLHSKLLTSEDDKLLAHVLRRHKELRLADLRSEAMEALVESAAEMGLELDWRRLNRIGAALGGRAGGEFFVPPAIVEVCRALARHRGEPFDLALDPFARQGLLLSALVDEGIAVRGVGRRAKQERRARVGTDDLWVDLSSEPAPVPGGSGGGSFEFDASATSELLVQLTGRDQGSLDLVVCCPPWGSCSGNIAKDRTRFRQLQHQLFFEAHRQLTQGGKMVFLMPASFWWAAEAKRLLEHAATEGGLTVDAAFHLAPGSVPGFPGSAYIVVATAGVHDGFQHSERGKLFAAELDDNEHRTAAVLQNLVDGRPGESLALGEFVDASSFRGFPSLVAAEDLKLLKRGRELEFVALSDVSVRIRRADRKSLAPGTLFIRRIGSERVASASADPAVLDEHPSRWVAVEVDLERADPEYLANWLNTKSGRVARRAVAFGGALMQVRERDLGELLVHLPPLEEQGERLRILARTRELTSVLRSVEEAAFLPSATIASLEESLSFDQREREVSLEEWSETLPFPLASVLRRYRQEADDPERAAGALLHFFEAFGEFWATVLISALEQEREIPGPRTTEIRSQIEAYGIHPLERSSMKTWEFVGGKIASWLRKQVLASAGAGAEPLLDPLRCLATRDRTVLDALLSREIVTILSRVGAMRNTERGHGGASSPQAARVLLDRLRSELLQLREVVAPVFDRLKLYRLGRADVLRGVIAYTVEVLQGSNAAFLKRELRLEDHPEKGSLVLSAGEGRCLVLVPLILMGPPKDASNACYFYNRTEAGTARFVSYHQGDKVEDHRVEPLAFLERWQQDFDGECVSS